MLNKKIKLSIFLISLFFLGFSSVCFAEVDLNKQTEAFGGSAGFGSSTSVADIVSVTISTFLGLLGIIFVGLMVYAGFHWMTANGEEEKVRKAQDTIRRAIIGLLITVSAYAITHFVFTRLPETGDGGSETIAK